MQDNDLRNLARVVSACTLGLWAFAAGLLIVCFSDRKTCRRTGTLLSHPAKSRHRKGQGWSGDGFSQYETTDTPCGPVPRPKTKKATAGLRSATAFQFAHFDHQEGRDRGCTRPVNRRLRQVADAHAPLAPAVAASLTRSAESRCARRRKRRVCVCVFIAPSTKDDVSSAGDDSFPKPSAPRCVPAIHES